MDNTPILRAVFVLKRKFKQNTGVDKVFIARFRQYPKR